jgi:hypothetical protein
MFVAGGIAVRAVHIGLIKREEIVAAVERAARALAPDVVRVQYRFGEDWTGDPSIYFGVILSDQAASQVERLHEFSQRVQTTLEDAVDVEELGLQSYFNFRSESEQAKLKDPNWP